LVQNEKLLDSLALKLVLMYNYRKGGPDEAAWKTKAAPGVQANRLFIKPGTPGSARTIELAITESPQGGFELVIYGQQVEQSLTGPNPDFPAIQQLVNQEVARIEQTPPPPPSLLDLNYETYYLSYVVADHAVALLKTLGYTTIEYNGQTGESLFQTIYNPIKLGTGRPPIIVKLIDSSKTSIMENPPTAAAGAPAPTAAAAQVMQPGATGTIFAGVPSIGGTYLHGMTSGEPEERLLILYDKNDPEALQGLLNLLETTVDVPSRQIMIEALVVELDVSNIRNLGVTFETVQNSVDVASAGTNATTGLPLSIFTFTKGAPEAATFNAELQALLTTNQAQILSNPSVLVLDDRQARIQIGEQVPVSQQVTSLGTTVSSVSYFPVGIVLNLRPRVSDDGSEVTMQTETIVSSIDRAATSQIVGTQAVVAPVVDNRQVQSIVRVADNTPFIIGGLISTNDTTATSGIPFLAQIPLLGNLFKSSTVTRTRQEVIIVVTPHVVPLEDKYFSYLIPKDSSQFDRFKFSLFRNAYRIRGNDIFDLSFIYDSNVYQQLVKRVAEASASDPQLGSEEPLASVAKGGAPGEDILVRRMLWEIIDHTDYGRFVSPDHIIFFKNNPSAAGGAGFQLTFLNQELKNLKHEQNALALTFEAQPKGTEEQPLVPPKAVVSYPQVTEGTYPEVLVNGNDRNPDGTPHDWMVLLSKNYSGIRVPPFKLLQEVLVLKRLLELNKDMPLTLKEFHIGRQIVFPSQEELERGHQFIDREAAKLFYEVYNYYPAFQEEFNRQAHLINARLEKAHSQ
jgi:Flp pilus assembly secretin CpaC